jgi:O-6-methylguanine DNA methyltransferase
VNGVSQLYVKNVGGVWFGVAYKEETVLATAFSNGQQATLGNLLEIIPFNVAFQVTAIGSFFAEKVISLLKNICDGKEIAQCVPLSFEHLPVYTRRVLKTVSKIPVGYISSYGLVAKAAGGGARAVGNVMATNPFVPLIPCHRVVTSDFRLGGYGGGLAIKFELLKRERKDYTDPLTVFVNEKQLQVFPTELVFLKLEKKFPNLFKVNPYAQNRL